MTRSRRSRGFTMIELMISATLFLLIAGGAMLLVLSGNRSQSYAAHLDVAQSSLRAGFDFISRDVISASAGASTGTIMDSGLLFAPVTVTDSATGPDSLDLYLVDSSPNPMMLNVLAPLAAGSTSVILDNHGPFDAASTSNPMYVQIGDLASAIVVRVNGLTYTTYGASSYPTLTLFSAIVLPPTVSGYPAGSFAFLSKHVRYAIDPLMFQPTAVTGVNNSVLTLCNLVISGNVPGCDANGPQPLAEGVEDMQIALGYDTNYDGVITEVGAGAGDDEWLYNVPGDIVSGAAITNLKAVRVTLVANDTQKEQGNYPGRPAAENHPAGARDGYPRRVLRTVITVRNFNL